MTEAERIQDQLTRAHSGDAWHGPSLLKLLEDVDGARAEDRPIEGAHSIRELVAHLTAWQDEARRRLEGNGRDLPPAEDWPAPASWSALLARLRESHSALIRAVGALDDASLDQTLPGRKETAYVLLHGTVQHNLYHAGQIAILKKALAAAG
jgi:uncharacterized damage-inducible protein DinB